MIGLQTLSEVITAIGGLGTASFGLVDATKVLWGGPNRFGFAGIETAVRPLVPPNLRPSNAVQGLPPEKIVATVRANWFNGIELVSQKAIAKSLIKLNLGIGNAGNVAKATGVDGNTLTTIAGYMAGGGDMLEALVVGLLATPLAPIAKDLSTALATAVNTMQAVKK